MNSVDIISSAVLATLVIKLLFAPAHPVGVFVKRISISVLEDEELAVSDKTETKKAEH